MSLLRLLKAGRSLVNPRESASRYRMREGVQLPKFGSDKNPFSARGESQAVPAAPGANLSESAQPRELSQKEIAAARLKETVRLPVSEPLPPETKVSPSVPSTQTRPWWNPWGWGSADRSPARPARRRPVEPAVQGELSLDQIRVVRNDLSDSDVEIVQPRPAKKTRAAAEATE